MYPNYFLIYILISKTCVTCFSTSQSINRCFLYIVMQITISLFVWGVRGPIIECKIAGQLGYWFQKPNMVSIYSYHKYYIFKSQKKWIWPIFGSKNPNYTLAFLYNSGDDTLAFLYDSADDTLAFLYCENCFHSRSI